jgi:hypothetical protein
MWIETCKGSRELKFSRLRYGDKTIDRVGVSDSVYEESNYIFPDDINIFQEKYKVDDVTLENIKNYMDFRSGY